MLAFALLAACRIEWGPPAAVAPTDDAAGPQGEVWVYTSMYPHVIEQLDALVRADLPGVAPKFFQGGSEKVAQRVEAEWAAGGSPACLLLTSDPAWYVDLADRGLLSPHLAPNVLQVDRGVVDPEGRWVASRLSMMVIAVDPQRVAPADRPTSWADLARVADRASMPDPLASGTAFTTLALWAQAPGWEAVAAMRRGGLVAAGGGSAVVGRIESGERPIGVVLLENALQSKRKGASIEVVYPDDGAIVIPGPIALTAGCPNRAAAKAVYDLVLSPAGQRLLVGGDLYSVLDELPPPDGAPRLADVPTRPWAPGQLQGLAQGRADLKDRWAALASE